MVGEGLIVKGIEKIVERGRFWKKTIQDAWGEAVSGPNGGKICPTCGKEVNVAPGQGPRDWDMDHAAQKWKQTQDAFRQRAAGGEDITRRQVSEAYQEGVRLRCPSCNRADNKVPGMIAGGAGLGASASTDAGASSGSLWDSLPSWREFGEGLLDFLVSPGTANAPTLMPRAGASGSWSGGGAAGGGFLLYPNKSNTNMMQSVYSK